MAKFCKNNLFQASAANFGQQRPVLALRAQFRPQAIKTGGKHATCGFVMAVCGLGFHI